MANPQSLTPFTTDDNRAAEAGSKGGTNKKGSRHVSKWIDELLHDESFKATVRQGLEIKEFHGAPIKAIVGAQMALAIQGDSKAADLLFKYGYGTKQTIEHEGSVTLGTPDPEKAAKFANFLKEETKD